MAKQDGISRLEYLGYGLPEHPQYYSRYRYRSAMTKTPGMLLDVVLGYEIDRWGSPNSGDALFPFISLTLSPTVSITTSGQGIWAVNPFGSTLRYYLKKGAGAISFGPSLVPSSAGVVNISGKLRFKFEWQSTSSLMMYFYYWQDGVHSGWQLKNSASTPVNDGIDLYLHYGIAAGAINEFSPDDRG